MEEEDAYQKWKSGSEDTAPEEDREMSGWEFFMSLPLWMRISLILVDLVMFGALVYFYLL